MREHDFPPIRTARLTLRPAVRADAAPLAALMTPAISARLAAWPIPWTASLMRARIVEWRAIGLAGVVRRTEDEALVGWVHALRKRGDAGRATMGWWCAEPHQGRGYIREAAAALLPVAFDRLGVAVVEAGAQPDNHASLAVMRALGMRRVGERLDLAPARGREERIVVHEVRAPGRREGLAPPAIPVLKREGTGTEERPMAVKAGTPVAPEDIALIRDWFARLAEHVRAVDFAPARALFAEDFIAFGTHADFMNGRDNAEASQWRRVWPTIDGFTWRLDGVQAVVSPDRLHATGMAVWDSTGYREDGTPFDRLGRATVTFAREAIGDPWVATHTHMSLFRGTPEVSHGRKPSRS